MNRGVLQGFRQDRKRVCEYKRSRGERESLLLFHLDEYLGPSKPVGQPMRLVTYIKRQTSIAFMMLSVAALTLAGGCQLNFLAFSGVVGSGVSATRQFEVADFSEIQVSGAAKVNYTTGEEAGVTVTVDDNIIDLVQCDVSGGKLKISVVESYRTSLGMTIDVTSPELSGVKLSGASSFQSTNSISTDRLNISLSGASSVQLSGNANELIIDGSGACKVNCEKLKTNEVTVDLSGASKADLNVVDQLDAKLSGASKVSYRGEPSVTVKTSGASKVNQVDPKNDD